MFEQQHLHYPPADIDPAVRALIKHKVRKLVGSYGFTRNDADDLEQELALKAFLAGAKFDPARGSAQSFYNRVLSNKANSLARHATSQKRDRRREAPPQDGRELAPTANADLRLDVEAALAPLCDEDCAVARLLATDGVAAVAVLTGLSRGQVRGARRRIARALAANGLSPANSGDQRPVLPATRYVFGEGVNQVRNSRPTGRKAKVVGVPPVPGTPEASPGKGAPSWPR